MRVDTLSYMTTGKHAVMAKTFYLLPNIEFTKFYFLFENEEDVAYQISFCWLVFYFSIRFIQDGEKK